MTVESALAAMAAAEQEIRGLEPIGHSEIVIRWGIARMRLIARDRATLERHTPVLTGLRWQLPESEQTCAGCTFGGSTRLLPGCPERNAVIDYWQEDA